LYNRKLSSFFIHPARGRCEKEREREERRRIFRHFRSTLCRSGLGNKILSGRRRRREKRERERESVSTSKRA